MRETLVTFSYSHFCCCGCFTIRSGFHFLVTKRPKAPTGSLTRALSSSKLTGRATGCYISIFSASGLIFFQFFFIWIMDLILLIWYRDDQIILNGLMLYIGYSFSLGIHLPLWRMDGVIMTILLHAGPVEFLYYWLHRLLHHHYLYSRYHSHHHSSIATEPITCNNIYAYIKVISFNFNLFWEKKNHFINMNGYFIFLSDMYIYVCSCDSSICGTHRIFCVVCNPTGYNASHRHCLYYILRCLHHLHRLDEQHGSLQLWAHSQDPLHLSPTQVSYVYSFVRLSSSHS